MHALNFIVCHPILKGYSLVVLSEISSPGCYNYNVQIQRAAQAERERIGQEWNPNFFHKQEVEGHESEWVFGGTYWTHRENNFRDITLPKLW